MQYRVMQCKNGNKFPVSKSLDKAQADDLAVRFTMQAPKGVSYVVEEVK